MHQAGNTPKPNTEPLSNAPPDSHRDVYPWLVLSHLAGLSPQLFNRLLDAFGSPGAILAGTQAELEAGGADAGTARAIRAAGEGRLNPEDMTRLDTCKQWLAIPGHAIVHRDSPAYPDFLAAIPDPPPLLYVAGNPACLHSPMIAMVGSRHPSAEGRRNARRFAAELAGAGMGVCSGLALGIDAASHAGALLAGGITVAVLGTGIDKVYPAGNAGLFQEVTGRGALVSEFNPGTPPLPAHFPRRNRIISGLSLGVLVVEAGLQSGSMITARLALEQGRDVFAIPGSIHNPMAKGCHRLIGQGAKLVQSVDDILEEFDMAPGTATAPDDRTRGVRVPANDSLASVLAAIGHDPVSLDMLLPETGMTVDETSAALVELELAGLVRREPGGYVRVVSD